MKIKDLIAKLQELDPETEILIAENWHSMGAVQQEVRDVLDTDFRIGKINEFPVMRNLSSHVEGLIIGHLNTYI